MMMHDDYEEETMMINEPTKIVDVAEAARWLAEGRTYQWMVEQYRTKYGIETTVSMWGDLRAVFNRVNRIGTVPEFIEWFDQIEEGFKA